MKVQLFQEYYLMKLPSLGWCRT